MDNLAKLNDYVKELESLSTQLEEVRKLRVKPGGNQEQSKQLLGDLNYRVLHVIDNPADQAIKLRQKEVASLKRENERLRARLSLLEDGNIADVTRRIDDAVNSSSQIEILTRKVNDLKAREEKILESFKKTSREFREMCYLLTGYRIDPLKDDVYRLSHMYAESKDDKLYFEVKDGTVTLLQNDYTEHYKEYITTYLKCAGSFSAFLAAITLDLFKTLTQEDMSINMSTTMIADSTRIRSNSTMRKY